METLDQQTTSNSAEMTPSAVDQLKRTAPWLMFFSVIGFLMIAFIVLLGVFMVSQVPFGGIIVVVYLIIGAILFFPILYLMQASNAIKRYVSSKQSVDLEMALSKQRAYWKYLGIFTIVYIALVLVMLIVGGGAFLSGLGNFQNF